jgi:hypothetical protein
MVAYLFATVVFSTVGLPPNNSAIVFKTMAGGGKKGG